MYYMHAQNVTATCNHIISSVKDLHDFDSSSTRLENMKKPINFATYILVGKIM